MPEITIDLIRRKAEHNEGLIHTLEELSLHQEELESINETLGCNCRRLKILYLQNNIIGEMKNLHHMKELEYLNLAVNNITKVRGLHSCEFLNKLDLTVNFIDLDELESSVDAMEGNKHLKDLYMMGNPCQSWSGFELYMIARLPQLEHLDGKEVTRTGRIQAVQRLPSLCQELASLAEEMRRGKWDENSDVKEDHSIDGSSLLIPASEEEAKASEGGQGGASDSVDHPLPAPDKEDGGSQKDAGCSRVIGDEELTKHTPEVRTSIYREMAEQKREKEERRKENMPKDRNFDAEQKEAVDRARAREAEGVIRQCNEGKLEFRFDEKATDKEGEGQAWRRGMVVLEVSVPRYLDSSLIDLDVHPHYVSVVIKGKVLRLSLPTEVKADEAKAQRSKTTGSLVVTMPKVDPLEFLGLLPASSSGRRNTGSAARANDNASSRTKRRSAAPTSTLAAMMIDEAKAAEKRKEEGSRPTDPGDLRPAIEIPQKAVSIRGIVGPRHGGIEVEAAPEVREVATSKRTSSDRRVDSHGDSHSSDSSYVLDGKA